MVGRPDFELSLASGVKQVPVQFGSTTQGGWCQNLVVIVNDTAQDQTVRATTDHDDVQLLDSASRPFVSRNIAPSKKFLLTLIWNPLDPGPLDYTFHVSTNHSRSHFTIHCLGMAEPLDTPSTPTASAPPLLELTNSPPKSNSSLTYASLNYMSHPVSKPTATLTSNSLDSSPAADSPFTPRILDQDFAYAPRSNSSKSHSSSHPVSTRLQRIDKSLRAPMVPVEESPYHRNNTRLAAPSTPKRRNPTTPQRSIGEKARLCATPKTSAGRLAPDAFSETPAAPRRRSVTPAKGRSHSVNEMARSQDFSNFDQERRPGDTPLGNDYGFNSHPPGVLPFGNAPSDHPVSRRASDGHPNDSSRYPSTTPSATRSQLPVPSRYLTSPVSGPKVAKFGDHSGDGSLLSAGGGTGAASTRGPRKFNMMMKSTEQQFTGALSASVPPPPIPSAEVQPTSPNSAALTSSEARMFSSTSAQGQSTRKSSSSSIRPAPTSARAGWNASSRARSSSRSALQSSRDGSIGASGSKADDRATIGGAGSGNVLRASGTRASFSAVEHGGVRDSWGSSMRGASVSTSLRLSGTGLPTLKKPRPVASLAIYHTESWQRKQERAFSGWVNLVLASSFMDQAARDHHDSFSAFSSRHTVLFCRQKLGETRETNVSVVHALGRVESQIKSGQLAFRENCLLDDAMLRKKAIAALMSYHPFWLHLGIDTVLNRRTFHDTGDDNAVCVVHPSDLEAVLREEFLSDSSLSGGANLRDRSDKRSLLSQLVLYRILTLTILLDRMPALVTMPSEAPFIFRMGASIKSSEAVIMACLHGSLKGMGHLIKHLEKMKYSVTLVQREVDEYPMRVESLARDFSNGIILCKLVSVLFNEDLMGSVRKPTADQRPIKLRNIKLALTALEAHTSVNLACLSANRGEGDAVIAVKADDVASGHASELLALIWAVALHGINQPKQLPLIDLRNEIKLLDTRNCGRYADVRAGAIQPGNDSEVSQLLLRWTRAVCAEYGVTIRNLTSSLTDGAAMCLLVHHYIPSLVSRSAIAVPQAAASEVAEELLGPGGCVGDESLSWGDYIGMQNSVVQYEIQEHRSGIMHNFQLLHTAAEWLGGVPMMLSADDVTSRFCDERSAILFVSALCPKLLSYATTGKASHRLVAWWRWKQIFLMSHRRGVLAARIAQGISREGLGFRWSQLAERICRVAFRSRAQALLDAHRCEERVFKRWTTLARKAAFIINLQRKVRARQAKHLGRAAAALYTYRKLEHLTELSQLSDAVTKIASVWRGYASRRRVRAWSEAEAASAVRQADASLLIQRVFRGHVVRKHAAKQLRAATTIQSAVRMSAARTRYLRVLSAITTIQAAVRMWQIRSDLKIVIDATITIQSFTLGMQARSLARSRRSAIVTLQAGVRGWCARRDCARAVHCVVMVQACCKRWVAMRRWRMQQRAALTIQSAFRGFSARAQCARDVRHVVHMQACARRTIATRSFAAKRNAALVVQAGVRGWSVRAEMDRQRSAAVLLQCWWRRHCARARFVATVRSVVTCQACVRRFLVLRRQERVRKAVAVVEHRRCGVLARRAFVNKHVAAVLIQSHVRARRARVSHGNAVASIVTCQACVRRFLVRTHQKKLLAAAAVVEKNRLCVLQRRSYLAQRSAAITIQTHVRSHRARQQYSADVSKIVLCQACVRRNLACAHYQKLRAAAIVIQTRVRSHQARRTFQCQREAAILIQSSVRSHQARSRYAHDVARIVTCQAFVRRMLAIKHQLRLRQAVASIEHARSGVLAVQSFQRARKAATTIQATVRMHIACKQYRDQRSAAITIQSFARGQQVRSSVTRSHRSACVIQSAWRSHKQHTEQAHAATTICAAYRGFAARRQWVACRSAAICIQSAVRMWQAFNAARSRHSAIVCVQSYARGAQVRSRVATQQRCAVVIQAAWRSYAARLHAATFIQRVWRAHHERMCAATTIQAAWRSYHAQKVYTAKRGAAICVQSVWRGRVARAQVAHTRWAARVLQRVVMRFCAKRAFVRKRVAVWRLEGPVRHWLRRKYHAEFLKFEEFVRIDTLQRTMARRITAAARGFLVRRETRPKLDIIARARRRNQAAVTIQHAWYNHQERVQAAQEAAAIAVLTSWVPTWKARMSFIAHMKLVRHRQQSAIIIQKGVRLWLQARSLRQQVAAVARLQALWRGRKVRTASSRKVKEASARLRQMQIRSDGEPSKKLGPRTRAALAAVLRSNGVEQAMSACAAMAWGTTYSKNACRWVVDEGCLSTLLTFLKSCNRSKPHQSMMLSILTILTNLLKHSSDVVPIDAQQLADFVPVLSDNMQFFRDSEDIFVCTVKVLRQICARPFVLEHIPCVPRYLLQWDGVCRLLVTRMKSEGGYIYKLEAKKGSDASADASTRRLLSLNSQLKQLRGLLEAVQGDLAAKGIENDTTAATAHLPRNVASAAIVAGNHPVSPGEWVEQMTNHGDWTPKNTIVKGIFHKVLPAAHSVSLSSKPAAAPVPMFPTNGAPTNPPSALPLIKTRPPPSAAALLQASKRAAAGRSPVKSTYNTTSFLSPERASKSVTTSPNKHDASAENSAFRSSDAMRAASRRIKQKPVNVLRSRTVPKYSALSRLPLRSTSGAQREIDDVDVPESTSWSDESAENRDPMGGDVGEDEETTDLGVPHESLTAALKSL